MRLFRKETKEWRTRERALARYRQFGPPDAFVSADYRELHPVDLNFNGKWQLLGFRFSREPRHLTLALRWRCLRAVFHRTWCFAHVFDPEGRRVASLDHELLDGDPPPVVWHPGDEGYEFRSFDLDPVSSNGSNLPQYHLRLGLYDPVTNLRLPLVRSNLAVTDEFTAAVMESDTRPAEGYVHYCEPREMTSCQVVLEGGVELSSYSVTAAPGIVWVRLRWSISTVPAKALMFFGHLVPSCDPEIGALVWLDQDLAVHGRGPQPRFVQDIVRAAPPAGGSPLFLRAGVCTHPDLQRLSILESSFDADLQNRCVYIPIDGQSS